MTKKELAEELEWQRAKAIERENALVQIVNLFNNYDGVRDFGMAVKMANIAAKCLGVKL